MSDSAVPVPAAPLRFEGGRRASPAPQRRSPTAHERLALHHRSARRRGAHDRHRRPARRGLAVFLVAPIVAAIAVASWHTSGRFVAAGDIGPFVRDGLAADVGALWGYGLTGAGSATVEIARLPELAVYEAAGAVGVAPELAQLVFFWLCLTGASAACVALARQLVRSAAAHVAVGVLAVANPLMAVNLPNPLVAVALCTLALFATALTRAYRGTGSVRVTVLATLPASYLAINPPTLAVVGFVCLGAFAAAIGFAAFFDGDRGRASALLPHAAVALPLAVLAHAWWLVPAAVVYAGGGGAAVAAVTDPEVWSWTHVNNTVGNVTTLTAHWGWGMHEYLPFSQDLDRLPMSPLRWALPTLIGMAPLVAATRARRRVGLVAAGVAIACIVIGKGLHGPAAGLNLELYRRVPGMWLLREPMSKVGPVLLLAYLVGAAIAVDGAVTRLRAASPLRASLGMTATAAVVAGAVAFGHPVLTGGVAPHDRTPLPSSRVEVPAGWYDLAAAVNDDPVDGKALVLPTLPFYQATTTWGFHGAATLPRDLLRRPTLLGLLGGYFADDAIVSGLVDVAAGASDPALVSRALHALGVSHVVVRTDLSDAQAVRPIGDARALIDRLVATDLFDAPDEYGIATVLRVQAGARGPTVFTNAATVAADTDAGAARAVATLPPDVAAIPGSVGVDISTTVFDGDAGRLSTTVHVPAPGWYRVTAARELGTTALASRTTTGVSVDPNLSLRIDGRPAATSQPLTLPAAGTGAAVALAVDGAPSVLADDPVPVDVTAGAHLQVLAEAGTARPVRGWSAPGDCSASDGRDPSITARVDGLVVELSARAHAACVTAPVPSATTGPALLRFDAEVVQGDAARACLWSDRASACTWERTMEPSTGGWQEVVDVIDVPSDGRLFLYADATSGPSTTRYRGVEFVPLVAGPAVTAVADLPAVDVELDGGDHVVELTQPPSQRLGEARIGPPSDVGNCNARDEATVLTAAMRGDAVRLEANGDAACVHYPVRPLTPGVSYDVRLEHRTLSHDAGRWCLWLDGPDRCANDVQVLDSSADWRVHRDRIVVPAGVTSVRLFVYADGDRGEGAVTRIEYRRPSIRVAAPVTVSITEAPTSTASAASERSAGVRSAQRSGDQWRLDVRGDAAPFVLALPDTADRRWTLNGLPSGATAEPTLVDGYRQAWVVSGLADDVVLRARYGPGRMALAAKWVSVVAVAGLIVPSGLRRSRRRAIPPRTRVKRAFDVVVAGTALAVGALPMAVIAVALRITMGRPVLSTQSRPGVFGRRFTIYMFRTTHVSPGGDTEPLTRLGRLLRSTSLDQLPELWNVLRGDMSLVGPRPLPFDHVQHDAPEHARRHDVRPGITGLAQVSGRTATTWEERLALDLRYLDERTLLLDMQILGRTVIAVLRPEGVRRRSRHQARFDQRPPSDSGKLPKHS